MVDAGDLAIAISSPNMDDPIAAIELIPPFDPADIDENQNVLRPDRFAESD